MGVALQQRPQSRAGHAETNITSNKEEDNKEDVEDGDERRW